ncbi:MAG: hypothetical protein O3A55_07895 [Bacteroidetes bacterium]|nr:hypothetical protein [Bacteroidota bacterium]
MKRKFINSVIIIHLLFFIGVFFSCNGTKQTTTKNEKIMQTETLQSSYNISGRTKQFLNELEKELKESNKNLKTFIPSKKLIDEYSIKQINETFFVSGFIKKSENFDKTIFENSEVTFGQPSGQIITINVPLYFLSDFLNHKEIEYFEISEKVHTK